MIIRSEIRDFALNCHFHHFGQIIIVFLLYCCFSSGICTLFFLYIVSCHGCITFLNMSPLILFSLYVENVGGGSCKRQCVCAVHRIPKYKSYLLLFKKQQLPSTSLRGYYSLTCIHPLRYSSLYHSCT